MQLSDITGPTRIALICAGLGFIVSFESHATSILGGVRGCPYTDYGALVFGGLAVLFGLIAILQELRAQERAMINLEAAGLAEALGLLHILRGFGFGIVGGPC